MSNVSLFGNVSDFIDEFEKTLGVAQNFSRFFFERQLLENSVYGDKERTLGNSESPHLVGIYLCKGMSIYDVQF